MENPSIIALNCPKCGATLSIPKGITYLTCNYCHSKLNLFQNDSIVALQMVSEQVAAVKEDTDIIASELTLKRLKKELNNLIDDQNSLIYAVAHVSITSDRDDDNLNAYIPERFRVFAIYTIEGLYNEKPGTTRRSIFSKAPNTSDRRRWLDQLFSEEDFKLMIEKFNVEKVEYKKTKKNLAIEKYISQIHDLISINQKIEQKRNQISDIKSKLG